MNNAGLYDKAKTMQTKDADDILDKHLNLIRWRIGDQIIDIGCGDGDVTVNLLMKRIPQTFDRLVGVDVSSKMIEYASCKFAENSLIQFEIMDIGAKQISKKHKQKYDHIFSFNCLHWVQDQHRAFKNIYDMMKDQSDLLVSFGAKNDIYDVYETLARTSKWKKYKTDVQNYISPYHHLEDPERTLRQLMKNIGFQNVKIESKMKIFYFYDVQSLKNAMMAVNPFIPRIPANLHDDYFEDYFNEVRNLDLIEGGNNNVGETFRIRSPYHSIVVYATKG